MRAVVAIGLSSLLACGDSAPSAHDQACSALEVAWSLDDLPQATCRAVTPPRDLSAETKIAVAVYHFNVQYVAGGLRGFPDGSYSAVFDLDEAEVEDRIIREGLEPALDLYLGAPTLHADFELQGYMVEVMARRHPDVLEKLRTLAVRGQIEVVSFHYSDQLYVAYPAIDLERSLDLTRAVFDRVCLPLGTSIFTQEGQFARGQIPIAQKRGYRASVLPKNLFFYQFGQDAAAEGAFFTDPAEPDHAVILGAESHRWDAGPGAPFELRWTFMDDGEIAFTENKLNPYFGLDYVRDPVRLAARKDELLALERDGFVHATIREAIDAMRARGIAPRPLPKVMDGTWQPDDTGNVFRWMGGGGLFRTFEQDSDLLAAVWRARSAVAAIDDFWSSTDPRLSRGARAAWREAVLAQVSDSTGWNPYRSEIAYSQAHAAAAETLAAQIRTCADQPAPALEPICVPGSSVAPAELGLTVISPARQPVVSAHGCMNAPAGQRWFEIVVSAAKLADAEQTLDDDSHATEERELEVQFALTSSRAWSWRPALRTDPERYDPTDYAFAEIAVPVLPGPIALGAVNRWLIPDATTQRVAMHLARTGSTTGALRWIDDTVSRALASDRRWLIVEGLDEAAATALARRLEP